MKEPYAAVDRRRFLAALSLGTVTFASAPLAGSVEAVRGEPSIGAP